MAERQTTDRIQLPMPCTCRPDGELEVAQDRFRAKELLGIKEGVEHDLVSNLVMTLWWNYRCTVDGLYCDMWFGVTASIDDQKYWIPCDAVEDGLVTLYLHLVDTKESTGEI